MKSIALVVQRYGMEVNGGAELYARILAEKLRENYCVEVLTTCAVDYMTWENHYPQGEAVLNGVKVRRFKVERLRDPERFLKTPVDPVDPQTVEAWVDEQGPYCPEFVDFIKSKKDDYDIFIFVTYLYYLTVRGICHVFEKAVLVPTAHDEPPIYFSKYKDIFKLPRAIVYNTFEEQSFVQRLFANNDVLSDMTGIGIDIPDCVNPESFREKYGLCDYLLYTGRIDESKNCPQMFMYFIEYKKRNPSDLKLVLMGKKVIEVPEHPDIISLGFVSDDERVDGMAGAKMLLLPSVFESLSLVVLESMAVGVPVVVNSGCEVAKGHCLRSNAGLFYTDYFEFEGCIDYLLNNEPVTGIMSRNAKKYIESNYRWDVVMEKIKNLIDKV